MNIRSIIFANQASGNMKSRKAKVLHKILGKPLISYPVEACKNIGSRQVLVLVGDQQEDIKQVVGDQVGYAYQGPGLVKAVQDSQTGEDIIILNGDAPLVTEETLGRLVAFHQKLDNDLSILSAMLDAPDSYRQIIRGGGGEFLKIQEEAGGTNQEGELSEVDGGIYVFKAKLLKAMVLEEEPEIQEDYRLGKLIQSAIKSGYKVGAITTAMVTDIFRVNSRSQLAQCTTIMKKRINQRHMDNGVTLEDPLNTYIESGVIIGQDTIIEPNCMLKGSTIIGSDCLIGHHTTISNTQIANRVQIENSQVHDSFIDEDACIGPFAYIRPNSKIGKFVKIGDFVEIKNANIGNYTKISHLTYVGDADVGEHVNFGCGSVLVNYDGINKHRSTIEDHAFIGCNTNLVSPVNIGERAFTAAGSTITSDVPKESLGISRAKQVNKEGWVAYKYPK